MSRVLVMATITSIGVFCCGWALAATESENFDVSPADWTEFMSQDTGLGTDFGYSATNNAGGVMSGEAGGTFPRTQMIAYYADTTLGDTSLEFDSPLMATGKLSLLNDDADGRIDIGWFDQNDPPGLMDLIGFSINNGNALQAVARPGGDDYANTLPDMDADLHDGTYDFTLLYDGAGQLQITFVHTDDHPDSVASLEIPEGTYELNAFGLTTSGEVESDNPLLTAMVFIDDLTYTVGGGAPQPIAGDYDGNTVVDVEDYNFWRARFGNTVTPAFTSPDGSGNEVVDAADYVVWRKADGAAGAATSIPASVPEPASASIFGLSLLFGSILMLRRLRFAVPAPK